MATKRSDAELKHEIYAVLFSVGNRMLLDEIARIVKTRDKDRVAKLLSELERDLDKNNGPVVLMKDGNEYKLQIRSKFLDLVQKVCKLTELPKSVLETLAVVAYKSPVLQSDVVAIRTNKAYDHLKQLEEQSFLTREQHGRTKLVRITQKFYDYFEISPEELQKQIAKRNIQEQGEHQQKITTMLDKAGTLEVYDEKSPHSLENVQVYQGEHVRSTEENQNSPVDDWPNQEPNNQINPEDSGVFLEDLNELAKEKQNSSDSQSNGGSTDSSEAKKDDEFEPTNLASDAKKKKQESSGNNPEDESPSQDEPEYEPLKVKGGFKEFSKDEKKKIKDRADEIKGEDDEESDV